MAGWLAGWLAYSQDFDPFDIPMPIVAPGVTPEEVRRTLLPMASLACEQSRLRPMWLFVFAVWCALPLFLGQAFAELDTDGDGIIKGEEFAAIPKSDKFNKVTRAEMVRACW